MAPKKVTNVEKPKRNILFKKKKSSDYSSSVSESRGDEQAHQEASFYGICLTFQAVISLHYTFYFYLVS
jgi:hypothetical protein